MKMLVIENEGINFDGDPVTERLEVEVSTSVFVADPFIIVKMGPHPETGERMGMRLDDQDARQLFNWLGVYLHTR